MPCGAHAGLAARGFSTSGRQCALQNFSFAHEIGHNIGMSHGRGVVSIPRPGAFNFGYVLAAHCVRSVMAYDNARRDACASKGGGRRLNVFSSPRLRFRDAVPFGRPLNDALAAYNMEVLCRAGTVLAKNDTVAQGGQRDRLRCSDRAAKTGVSPGETFTFAVQSNKDCNLLVYTSTPWMPTTRSNCTTRTSRAPSWASPGSRPGERRVIPVSGRARITETRGEYQIGAVCGGETLPSWASPTLPSRSQCGGRRSFTFVIEQIAKKIDRTQLASTTVTHKVD